MRNKMIALNSYFPWYRPETLIKAITYCILLALILQLEGSLLLSDYLLLCYVTVSHNQLTSVVLNIHWYITLSYLMICNFAFHSEYIEVWYHFQIRMLISIERFLPSPSYSENIQSLCMANWKPLICGRCSEAILVQILCVHPLF